MASRHAADQSFLHFAPTRVVFGLGAHKEAPLELRTLGKSRAMLVTDAMLAAKTDLVERVKKALGATCVAVFAEVQPDSPTSIVDRGAQLAREHGIDAIVSLGGGSAIDTAKGIAIAHTEGGSVLDHQGFQNLTRPTTVHLAIPTTAGTGSEVTRAAVLFDEKARQKLIYGDFHLFPRVAVLDPELTVGMPASITAGTGLDALTHAIEAMHSAQREPIADALALQAIRYVRRYLPTAVRAPNDLEARGKMLLAATMAGQAFDNAQVGVVHAIAHSVGAKRHVHHGTANAIALPHCIRFNADDPAAAEAYRDAAEAFEVAVDGLGPERAAHALADAVEAFVAEVGLPTRLRQVGVVEDDLRAIAEMSVTDASIVYNPKFAMDADLVLGIVQSAY
ncbi:MAG: iron-containing alcohol dehydrogenase [Deltaproteobacteria bacterium]|nr:iron-containing alcohol dehydrogenase [Deltaproteobacteria bacterium]